MHIVSVNVGLPREVVWKGKTITTGIFKEPVDGRVPVRTLNLDGDRQADLTVHGGTEKAVYAYPSEHYDFWRRELPEIDLPWGMFGENLTTTGLYEDSVAIGDRFRVGTATLIVTQPRMPCYKLAVKFGRDDIVKQFLDSGRTGFYFAVLDEGEVGAGDTIKVIEHDPVGATVDDVSRLYAHDRKNLDLIRRVIGAKALPESWRDYFVQRLENITPDSQEFA